MRKERRVVKSGQWSAQQGWYGRFARASRVPLQHRCPFEPTYTREHTTPLRAPLRASSWHTSKGASRSSRPGRSSHGGKIQY